MIQCCQIHRSVKYSIASFTHTWAVGSAVLSLHVQTAARLSVDRMWVVAGARAPPEAVATATRTLRPVAPV